jgi:hypothetical protein
MENSYSFFGELPAGHAEIPIIAMAGTGAVGGHRHSRSDRPGAIAMAREDRHETSAPPISAFGSGCCRSPGRGAGAQAYPTDTKKWRKVVEFAGISAE